MPSTSEAQQRFMRAVYAYKKGGMKGKASKKVKDAAKSMSLDELKDFMVLDKKAAADFVAHKALALLTKKAENGKDPWSLSDVPADVRRNGAFLANMARLRNMPENGSVTLYHKDTPDVNDPNGVLGGDNRKLFPSLFSRYWADDYGVPRDAWEKMGDLDTGESVQLFDSKLTKKDLEEAPPPPSDWFNRNAGKMAAAAVLGALGVGTFAHYWNKRRKKKKLEEARNLTTSMDEIRESLQELQQA